MADLKIFSDIVEDSAREQINLLISQPAFADCKIRIMPDVHAGAGCVIGFTANLGEKVIPNIVGVDIGCGMLTINLGKIDIDYEKLDEVIRTNIPSGMSVHDFQTTPGNFINGLDCYSALKNIDRLRASMGTLGGGNHFIEIDQNLEGTKYLIVHTGSRNLGKQVAKYYQELAVKKTDDGKENFSRAKDELVSFLKQQGRQNEIESSIKILRELFQRNILNKELAYIEGNNRAHYLHDMQLCQRFASFNRGTIGTLICEAMNWQIGESFETIHNYIELETNMVRKGAISAKKGEKVLIPLNMRDGCIIGIGKGNEDWNYSAPHGAGRIMSRNQAQRELSLEEYQQSMKGIFTTSISKMTIDEAPQAYKPPIEIFKYLKETVDIVDWIKPVYNFKAEE